MTRPRRQSKCTCFGAEFCKSHQRIWVTTVRCYCPRCVVLHVSGPLPVCAGVLCFSFHDWAYEWCVISPDLYPRFTSTCSDRRLVLTGNEDEESTEQFVCSFGEFIDLFLHDWIRRRYKITPLWIRTSMEYRSSDRGVYNEGVLGALCIWVKAVI